MQQWPAGGKEGKGELQKLDYIQNESSFFGTKTILQKFLSAFFGLDIWKKADISFQELFFFVSR